MRTNQHSLARDAALRRLVNVNRLLAAGSLVAAGVLTDVAANAFPGHSPASLRAAAIAAHHKQQCLVCAPGQSTLPQQTTTQSNSQGEEGSAAQAPAPAPAPVQQQLPLVMSGGS